MYSSIKRLLDITASSVALVVLSSVMAVVAVLVRLTSPGPAIFSQLRVGKNGVLFRIYKFRTMSMGSENPSAWAGLDPSAFRNLMFHGGGDRRVTPLGSFLRRTSLDELPQLFNILVGDMSLVGPRPEIPELVEYYDAEARRRLTVPPGLTGLAQISGRSDLTMKQKLAYDLQYVDNASLQLDVTILFRTLTFVLSRRGAR